MLLGGSARIKLVLENFEVIILEEKESRWIIRTGKVKNKTEFCLSGWCTAQQPEGTVCGSTEQLPDLSGWMFVAFPLTYCTYFLLLHFLMGIETGPRPVQGLSCSTSIRVKTIKCCSFNSFAYWTTCPPAPVYSPHKVIKFSKLPFRFQSICGVCVCFFSRACPWTF